MVVSIISKWIPFILVPNSWDLIVTWHPLTCRMPIIQCPLLKSTKSIFNLYGSETYINLHAWLRGSPLPHTSSRNLWNPFFGPHRGGTHFTSLSWRLLFIRLVPRRVPSEQWWYPNPVSLFGFFASWSQITDNTNPGPKSLGFILISLDMTVSLSPNKHQKLTPMAQESLKANHPLLGM